MTDLEAASPNGVPEVGEYCRRVEEHLTRVNEGELIRIFGLGFELVRGWAEEGIPLSVVLRGIDRKAERHARGTSRRALRLEFCEADVRAVFDEWRRAVGVWHAGVDEAEASTDQRRPRRPSLAKGLERAAERLSRAAGRMDTPDTLREALSETLDSVLALREQVKPRRGVAEDDVKTRLALLDRTMLDRSRTATPDLSRVQAEAEAELAPYRQRLSAERWNASVAAGVDRLLRDRYGLPVLDPDEF